MKISVVIICKDGSSRLAETLNSVRDIGDEILLYDSGSTDGSVDIALKCGARVEHGSWEGYGRNRYKASQLAKNDWILMIDTDEVLDDKLRNALLNIDLTQTGVVYKMRYHNYFGNYPIRYGEWGKDAHIRMANKTRVKIEDEVVHEKLFLQPGLSIKIMDGFINHYTVRDSMDYARKMMDYAALCAAKYRRQGKRASIALIIGAPLFSFLQNYFFKLGLMDGSNGFFAAGMTACYPVMTYERLKDTNHKNKLAANVVEKAILSKAAQQKLVVS